MTKLKTNKRASRRDNMITKEMVNNYLSEDYDEWIANVLKDICNDPHDIYILKKQIIENWEQHLENSKD